MRWTRIGSSSWAFLALVISFSAIGRSALALASVVTMPSAANSDAARLAIISRWCWRAAAEVAGSAWGCGHGRVSVALGQPRSVRPRSSSFSLTSSRLFWPKLVMFSRSSSVLVSSSPIGVDLGPLEAVARALGQVEVLDRQVEVGRAGGDGGDLAELEALRLVAQVGDEVDQRAQRGAGRGQRLAWA